ncbi:unnamed protein product [Gordionus sp. m RMFG-2023]
MNKWYVKSSDGIVKLLNIIFGLLCILCLTVTKAERDWTEGFLLIMAIICLILTILLLFVWLFGLYNTFILPWNKIVRTLIKLLVNG